MYANTKKSNKIKWRSITCGHIWHVHVSKCVYWSFIHFVKVWLIFVILFSDKSQFLFENFQIILCRVDIKNTQQLEQIFSCFQLYFYGTNSIYIFARFMLFLYLCWNIKFETKGKNWRKSCNVEKISFWNPKWWCSGFVSYLLKDYKFIYFPFVFSAPDNTMICHKNVHFTFEILKLQTVVAFGSSFILSFQSFSFRWCILGHKSFIGFSSTQHNEPDKLWNPW